MPNLQKTLIFLACALLLAGVLYDDAAAIPAFARQHKLSCTTCHAPFPRLKDYGAEFAANGFAIPEGEKERDYITAGDDLLKLNKTFPVAVRFDAFALAQSEHEVSNDLQTPWGLKLLSGGTLARNVGYYFYFFMNEAGEVAGVEDAYIHFNDLGGQKLDLMIGQFQTSDPLMKRELRLTYADYDIYGLHIGDSRTNLTYDRGVMVTYDLESSGTGFVAQVVNGNGKEPAEDDLYDQDKYKNLGLRGVQALGNLGHVGVYYYTGQELGGLLHDTKNEVTYFGPDFMVGNGTFDLTVQYLQRKDTNPLFEADAEEIKTNGMVVELIIAPQKDRSRNYLTLLYNQIDCDWDDYDGESMTASLTHLFARNLRGTLEYTRNLEQETDRGVIGLVSAF